MTVPTSATQPVGSKAKLTHTCTHTHAHHTNNCESATYPMGLISTHKGSELETAGPGEVCLKQIMESAPSATLVSQQS